ncbi:MAG: class III poly(R)-hydroxyalkanoic acid synthase subunit PhaC [Phycisphaerales bacterium]
MSVEQDYAKMWPDLSQAVIDESVQQMRRMSKLPGVLKKAQNTRKGASRSEVVYQDGRVKLLHYHSDAPPKYRQPLLFVFALVNRPYILDLLPGKSVVEHFVKSGFDTYLIDWGKPTHAERNESLDTYVNGYIPRVVEHLKQRCDTDNVNILGYCMGGTLSTMFTALHPDMVRNLILLAAGIDFTTREGLLNIWADEKNFDVDGFVDAFGNCPAEYLQWSFLMLKPIQNLMQKPISFMERIEDDKFVNEFLTMETWLNDNIAVPGEVYREFVKYLYQQNQLTRGELTIRGRRVDLKKITCPVLNLMARRDDLVPCSQSEPFNDLVGSSDRKTIKLDAGHIGLAVGSRAQKELWPQAVQWLAERTDS